MSVLPNGREISRLHKILFVLIVAGSVLVRILYLLELESAPDVHGPRLDGLYHHYWAQALVTGDWTPPEGEADPNITGTPYFRPPGYPWFLAAIYALCGSSSLPVRIVQMILGLSVIILTYRMAFHCAGPVAAGVAAALQAGLWTGLYYEGCWLDSSPLTLLLLGSLYLIFRFRKHSSWAHYGLAGLALGLAGLIRPNAFLLVPVAFIWMNWIGRQKGWTRHDGVRSCWFLLVSLGVILIPLARNRVVSGEWIPISTNGGINLLLGAGRESTLSHGNWLTGDWSCFDAPAIVERLSGQEGKRLSPGEADRLLAQTAWQIHRENPLRSMRLAFWKILLYWTPCEVSNNGEEELEREASPVLSRCPVSSAVLIGLGMAGFGFWIYSGRNGIRNVSESVPLRRSEGLLLLLTLLVYSCSFIPFVIAGQYRVPLAPLLAVSAGVAVSAMVRLFQTHRWLGSGLGVLWGSVCLALVFSNPVRVASDRARWHYMRGQMYARSRQVQLEETEYRAALQLDPNRQEVLLNLGILLFERKSREAESILIRANHVRESALGNLYLGRMEQDHGRMERAMSHYQAAEALNPEQAEASYRLGLLLMEAERFGEAAAAFHRAVTTDPEYGEARFGLGWAWLEAGQPERALVEFMRLRTEIRVEPAVFYQGGRALAALGRKEEARSWWKEYLLKVPDDAEIRLKFRELE